MNKGPNVCGDTDGKMPDGYEVGVPYIPPINAEITKPTKYFLYGLEATVHACTPDGYNGTDMVSGWETTSCYFIEQGGVKYFFFKKDLTINEDGSVQLDSIIFKEI